MKRLAVCGLCLVGLVVACSGRRPTDTDSDPDYLFPTEESFCAALGQGDCNDAVVKACYGSDQSSIAEDRESCRAARSAQCNPGTLPYHPEAAEACVVERQKALEDAVWTKEELAAVEAACLPVFSKEGPDGAACVSDYDCLTAEGLRCVVKFGSKTGVCGVPKLVVGGESCADPLAVCDVAYYCEQTVSACLKRPAVDEECSEAAPCAEDFYCSGIDPGTCVVKTKNGLACTKDVLCSGGFCIGATETTEGVCSSTLPLQLNAESCNLYRQ